MSLRRISDWILQEELEDWSGPLVVQFNAAEDPTCREARREVQLLAEAYFDVRFFEVDLTENPGMAETMFLRKLPATIVFVRSSQAALHVGSGLTRVIRSALQRALEAERGELPETGPDCEQ